MEKYIVDDINYFFNILFTDINRITANSSISCLRFSVITLSLLMENCFKAGRLELRSVAPSGHCKITGDREHRNCEGQNRKGN